ncbi:MAG: class I SAM-dependent methyltransferase [Rudaea sp.]
MKPIDRLGFKNWRDWATGRAGGRVIEIGVGSGLNLPHYRNGAHVIALDVDFDRLHPGRVDGRDPAPLLLGADAESLPFPDASFDSAVGTLVFCTIVHPDVALREIRRVLKPGASLRLVEHVRGNHRLLGALADLATPSWKRVAGGCHLNRDTLAAVREAGFDVKMAHERYGGLLIGLEAKKPNREGEKHGTPA